MGGLVSCQGLYTPSSEFFPWTGELKNRGGCGPRREGGAQGGCRARRAVMGWELGRLELPQACSWVGMGGQRLSPGTWGAGISGMWP